MEKIKVVDGLLGKTRNSFKNTLEEVVFLNSGVSLNNKDVDLDKLVIHGKIVCGLLLLIFRYANMFPEP